jgi:4-amino-4-deoxy-L-arabinose transferase-like glycosyltransferase
MLIVRQLHDEPTALWSGVILATSFAFVFFARNASTDIETIAGVLATLWIFLRHEASPAGRWILLLWFVMALTSLTKGLLGFVLPTLIIGLYATFTPSPQELVDGCPWNQAPRTLFDRNRWLFNRWSLFAIPLGALVYLGPFLLSIVVRGETDGLEMVYRENIRRFFDPVNHRGPIYLYGYVIFALMAPWSLLLPAALVHAHFAEARSRDRGRTFALAYFWGTFLFFTLSSSRRSYYLLPILPAGAFLISRMLACQAPLGRTAYVFLLAGFLLSSLVVILSLGVLLPISPMLPEPWDRLPPVPAPWAFVGMWFMSVPSVAFAWMKLGPRRIAQSMSVIAFSVMVYLYLFALPATERYRTQKPFADAVKQTIGSTLDRVALYRTREIVYYLDAGRPIAEYHTPEELQHGLREQPLRWILLRRRDWNEKKREGKVLLEEISYPWETFDAVESKLILVEVSAVGAR